MAVPHVVVLALTLVAVLCLPCIVAVLICLDQPVTRWARLRTLRRLDRRLDNDAPIPAPRLETLLGPSIEEIAADLRRLDGQRTGGIATESVAWLAAIQQAYDDRLRLACACLGITEHLAELDGLDREIERVRVEGALQGGGLVLRSVEHRPDVY